MAEQRLRDAPPRRRRWSASEVQEALVISGEIALWLVDGDDRIAFVNDAAKQILGYESDGELLGRPSHDTVHWKHRDGSPYPAEDCPITHATRRGETVRVERDWWVRKDGSMVPISCHCAPLEIDGRMGTAMTFHDLSASVRADEERRQFAVERARLEEVRASRARIVEAADAERRRVVRDIHDGAQQRLVYAVISLQLAQGRGNMSPDMKALFEDALEHTQGAIEELRELAHGIHPAVLTRGGLAAAVEELAGRAPFPVQVRLVEERYPASVESAAYFVAAEALTNVAKYSRASTARVTVTQSANRLCLVVEDDGVGGARPSPGSGLSGLEDRVATLDGTLAVDSPPGVGTRVRAEIPLPPEP
jgi:PAS domain S-box-containing protein